jgi:hypothetical protein
MPSSIMMTDNNRSVAMKSATVVAVAEPHVDILGQRGHCNAQPYDRRNSKNTAPHCTISLALNATSGRQCSPPRKVPMSNAARYSLNRFAV